MFLWYFYAHAVAGIRLTFSPKDHEDEGDMSSSDFHSSVGPREASSDCCDSEHAATTRRRQLQACHYNHTHLRTMVSCELMHYAEGKYAREHVVLACHQRSSFMKVSAVSGMTSKARICPLKAHHASLYAQSCDMRSQ